MRHFMNWRNGLVWFGAILVMGCGNLFDYNADEFKRLNSAGSRFENIKDDEIDAIVARLIDQKTAIVSPVSAAADFAAMSTNIVPGAMTVSTTALLDANDNPCKGTANVVECQPLQARYYFNKAKDLVAKLERENHDFARVALLLDIKYDAANPKPSQRATVPTSIKPLLPKRWKDSELAYSAPCRHHFKMLLYAKRSEDDTGIVPLSYLVVNSTPNHKTGETDAEYAKRKTDEDACAAANKNVLMTFPSELDGYDDKYFFVIDGKTGKIPDADDNTAGGMYIGFKDSSNFYVQAQLAAVPCQATYPAAPRNAVVDIVVQNGVWKGRIMGYSKHFGDKRDGPCDRTDDDYAASVYVDTLANATHVVSTTYTVNPALTDAQITKDQIADATTAISTHCDAGRWSAAQCDSGKIGTEAAVLSVYGAHACIAKDSAKVDKWFAYTGYDATLCGGLALTDFLASSYWRLPSYLKTDLGTLKVPEDKDL